MTDLRLIRRLAAGIVALMPGYALAQGFPSKSVRLVVPFPPGGGADAVARIIAPVWSDGLGQPVVVENRGGGGTVIATEFVAKNAADGYTTLIVYPSFVIAPSLRGAGSVDPIKDFTAVGQTISLPMCISVHPSLPVRSVRELVALARARPGEVAYGAGAGTVQYVIGEMLRLVTRIKVTAVPYQGAGQFIPALLGGHISMAVSNVSEIAPFLTSGKIRAIAVTTPDRADLLPGVQTMREAGFPELEATNWGGVVVRAGVPSSAINRLNAALNVALRNAAIADKLKVHSVQVMSGTPGQFSALIQSEFTRYSKVIREAGIKAD